MVLLGESAVGKTTLFRRWIGSPLAADYVPSTAAGIGIKLLQLDGHEPVVCELWDVPSQSFAGPTIFARYFRSTQAIVLVFSLQTPTSWRVLPTYLDIARQELTASEVIGPLSKPLPVVMVGNKNDCVSQVARQEQEAARIWCNDHDVAYVETSALTADSAAVLDIIKLVFVNYYREQ